MLCKPCVVFCVFVFFTFQDVVLSFLVLVLLYVFLFIENVSQIDRLLVFCGGFIQMKRSRVFSEQKMRETQTETERGLSLGCFLFFFVRNICCSSGRRKIILVHFSLA